MTIQMEATEQYSHVVLFIMFSTQCLLHFTSKNRWGGGGGDGGSEPYCVKATEQFFRRVVLYSPNSPNCSLGRGFVKGMQKSAAIDIVQV